MKKNFFAVALAAVMVVPVVTFSSCNDDEPSDIGPSEYVDLGLPSGTLWAKHNVGAIDSLDYGDYFAWGEVSTKSSFEWSNYKWYDNSNKCMTKYLPSSSDTLINMSELQASDDAATYNWGEDWQTPTPAQFAELLSNTDTTWITDTVCFPNSKDTLTNVHGLLCKCRTNDNYIFLPAAGYYTLDTRVYVDKVCMYMTRTLDTDESRVKVFEFDVFESAPLLDGPWYRCYGRSVRPVRKQ